MKTVIITILAFILIAFIIAFGLDTLFAPRFEILDKLRTQQPASPLMLSCGPSEENTGLAAFENNVTRYLYEDCNEGDTALITKAKENSMHMFSCESIDNKTLWVLIEDEGIWSDEEP